MADDDSKTAPLTQEDAENVVDAAEQLAISAGKLTKGNPFFALGALSMATAQVGVFVGIKYKDLIQLISDHFERSMLLEVERELKEAGGEEIFLSKQWDEQTDGKKD